MKTKLLIVASTVLLSNSAYSVTVYEDEVNKVDIGGAFLMDYFQPVHFLDHFFNTSRSTLNIGVARTLNDKWSTDVKFEWDTILNPPSNEFGNKNGDKFRSRLGYISVNHTELGSLRIGKQYSAYYDVAGYMDNLIVFDPDATPLFSDGKDGGFLATARGDNLVVYRNNFDALNLSAQYGFNNVSNQMGGLTRDNNLALALSYDFDSGLSLGTTYMRNKVEGSSGGLNDGDLQELTTVAAKYVNQGFQISAAYTIGENAHETDLFGYGFDGTAPTGKPNLYADANAYDVYAHYYFAMGIRPYIYLSNVDFDDSTLHVNGDRNIYSFGISYHATPQFIISGEVRATEEDGLGAGKRDDTLSGMTIIYAF
ncbi:porin [Vibrio owensii]|uniref:porin n=1 Tax=Vibrio owensii TaxID=696485 RepID=UPI0038CD8BB7